MKRNSHKVSSVICGLLFLAAGAMLFMLPEYKSVILSWPMLLVAIGFVFLFSRDKWFAGVILLLVGGFFLLPKLNIERLEFITQNGWAIGLVIIGVLVVYRAIFGKRFLYRSSDGICVITTDTKHGRGNRSRCCGSHGNESGYIDRNCVFSGGKEKMDIKNFKGGEINSVFGGIELDLSDSQLAEGTHRLELNSVFLGIVLFVPLEWNIEIQQTQVFGNFVDNRPKRGFEVDEKRTLIIEANAVFGGGEIKCK
jgi:predicted membrane protein